jgi:hypothetical protein
MSKKLIAVAAAAALALTGLVATPATSAVGVFTVSVVGTAGGTGLTDANAYTVNLPTQDVLRYEVVSSGTTSVFRLNVQSPGTTDTVRVVSEAGVKVLNSTDFAALTATTNNTKAGSQDTSIASVTGDASFYVFATTTTAKKVTVTSGSSSTVVWVKGINPVMYNVELVTAPAVIPTSGDAKFDFKITDAFGNEFTEADRALTISRLGGLTLGSSVGTSWDTDRKTNTLTVSGSAAGPASLSVSTGATKVTAFGTPKTYFATVTVGGTLTETITALTTQVAALQASVSALTADYNKLATRWNTRYDLKKAPKKKVALK